MSDLAINLTLPMPPSTNNLYFTMVLPPKPPQYKKHRAIRVPSDELKAFKANVAKICQDAGIEPIIGEVEISMRVFRPRRAGDLDGYLKSTIDSLSGFAYIDDKQVSRLHADRFEDKFNPRVEVEIRALGLL